MGSGSLLGGTLCSRGCATCVVHSGGISFCVLHISKHSQTIHLSVQLPGTVFIATLLWMDRQRRDRGGGADAARLRQKTSSRDSPRRRCPAVSSGRRRP